jgi:D-alanyl-D-alanine endopeptidase (penicillin-binding protein 7)
MLTITDEDVDNERHSRSRLKVGSTLTRREALLLALMSSENRAAHALGRAYPGGMERLVAAMNAKAQALGMKNTRYVDPTGLSNRNQSTARDLVVLVGAVAGNPVLAEFSITPTHLASLGGRTLQYRNSNRLVRDRKVGWDIGLQKTGYIVEAGRCLTMLTKVAGQELVMVLLDADTNRARIADAERMRRWVVAQRGVPDTVAQAAADKPLRKIVARKKKQEDSGKRTAVVASKVKDGKASAGTSEGTKTAKDGAKKSTGKTRTAGAKKRAAKPTVARKVQAGTDARVRQSFAGAQPEQKI